jgi:hypothetical protein
MNRRRVLSLVGALALAAVMGVGAYAVEKTRVAQAGCACCGDACGCSTCCGDTCACCGDACGCTICCEGATKVVGTKVAKASPSCCASPAKAEAAGAR